MLREEEVQVDSGRCEGGTFLCVRHLPTGLFRSEAPLTSGEAVRTARSRFLAEIEEELQEKGLSQYIVPAYRKKAKRSDRRPG